MTQPTNPTENKTLHELIELRSKIESQIDDLAEVLKTHNVDMDTPLLTDDGFPRGDLDIPTIRTTRVEIIRLRNDLKHVMTKIEHGLVEYFNDPSAASVGTPSITTTAATTASNGTGHASRRPHIAFAKVESVAENSPASAAGLQNDDRIVQFGDIHAANHQSLSRLASVVHDHQPINVTVKRGDNNVELTLTPDSSFPGRGSLGCHILPI